MRATLDQSGMAKDSIRKSARGQDCQVRIPGVCDFNPETTVLAHLPGGGMAAKRHDIHAAYCCSDCHDVVDGRVKHPHTQEEVTIWFHEGVFRTQNLLIEQGLIKT